MILTAIRLEWDAALKVEAGAVPGSVWEEVLGPSGLPVAFRPFVVENARPLRVAVAVAPDMGATAAVNTLLPLLEELEPRCIAMCGICAGRRGRVQLGDVVAADRLYYHDSGKQLPGQVQQDLMTYKLRDDWKAALESMDVVAHFRNETWFQARPLTTEWRLYRALVALRDQMPEPWEAIDPAPGGTDEWPLIVAALRRRRFLEASGRSLTKAGHRFVDDLLFKYMNVLPDLSTAGSLHPFRLHVAPIGSGTQVIEDEDIWTFVSQAMRKTLGIEMEAAALGELSHRQRQYKVDAVVMKGVMDFADHGRDGHFKEFAARASAECLLWFLREHVSTEPMVGFDDLLMPGTLPLPSLVPAPSVLLNARYAVVPWHEVGRSEILAELDAWADDPSRAVAVRLLHGEGGIGKTRLAIEWVRRRRGQYDVAGFLMLDPDNRWLERLCGLGPPVLVVIDYAENRADLANVLQRVAVFGTSSGPRRRVRVLLLARSDGDWWKALLQQNPSINALQNREPVNLLPLAATTSEREALFLEASRKFAAVRDRPAALRAPIALDDARFERVLYLHMAALAAVENTPTTQGNALANNITFDAASLMEYLLDHEERFWVRQARYRSGSAIDVRLARQLMAAATLRGGFITKNEARETCERLEERPRTAQDDALVALLHDIYESLDGTKYLPGLMPNLLGEGMVLRTAQPPKGAGEAASDTWIERVLDAGDDDAALTAAFTVLGRASVMNPTAVRPWMANLLRNELPKRAVLALRASKVVGQQTASAILGDVLAEALERDGSASIALELAQEGLPYPTVSLRRVAEWQSRIRLEHAVGKDDHDAHVARAGLLLQQGIRLGDLGQHEPALATIREAVDLYRTLATRNADAFQPYLANSLNNLGANLNELGQREAALAAMSEAVSLYRALATRNPGVFQADLAMSLNNLGSRLSELGQREAALAATHEAAELYRILALGTPDAFQADLAMSLNNLGNGLSELGQREAALAATREATDHYRELATRNPDAFQPDLAMSLNNLGIRLSELGQREAALAVTREAVDLYHTLATRHPEAFQPNLASTLNNLGVDLNALGQREAALAVTREAVDIYRNLAARNPDTFRSHLARSLNNLGGDLNALGQREPALAATLEAVDLYRVLATRHPDAFQPDLAASLNNLGIRLSELGELEPALAATREAVDLHHTLATRHPDAFQPDLATSLNNLGARLSELGQREAALIAAREAVDIRRTLARRNADAFQPDLATSLNSLGGRLNELGQREPALAATRDAVDLYRTLATRNPDVFQPALAGSLVNLSTVLKDMEQHEAALIATREAVELYRNLSTRNPDSFQPDLAGSLTNLGARLSELGQREPALAAAREALKIRRMLATRHPDAFQPDLAESLTNLAARLSELDHREPALAATREAVDLYRTLTTRNPDAFQPALASSLKTLSVTLRDVEQHEAALMAASEAVELYRSLAARNPDAFQSHLVTSLNNLGDRLHDLGRREAAVAVTREAMELYRSFAARNPDVIQASLATTSSGEGKHRDRLQIAMAIVRSLQASHPVMVKAPPLPSNSAWHIALPNIGLRLSQAILVVRQRQDPDLPDGLATAAPLLLCADLDDSLLSAPDRGPFTMARLGSRELVELADLPRQEVAGWLGRLITQQVDIEPMLPYRAAGATMLFFGRNEELKRLMGEGRRGGIILGVHQSGKSSLLHELKKRSERSDRVVVGPITLAADSFEGFYEQTLEPLGLNLDVRTPADWADEIRQSAKSRSGPVFLLDEVDWLVRNDAATRYQLGSAMRALQQDQHADFYLAGHLDLHAATLKYGSPFRNFANEVVLTGLTRAAASRLIREPIQKIGIEISVEQADRIFHGTAGMAALIQEFCGRMLTELRGHDSNAISNDVIMRVEESPAYLDRVFNYFYNYDENVVSRVLFLLAAVVGKVTRTSIADTLRDRSVRIESDRIDASMTLLADFGILHQSTPGEYCIPGRYLQRSLEVRDLDTMLADQIEDLQKSEGGEHDLA